MAGRCWAGRRGPVRRGAGRRAVLDFGPRSVPASTTARLDAGGRPPAYRAQRIAYPWLAAPWRLRGLKTHCCGASWPPTWPALTLGAAFTARRSRDSAGGRDRVCLRAQPAAIVALMLDLADALALAALVGMALAARRGPLDGGHRLRRGCGADQGDLVAGRRRARGRARQRRPSTTPRPRRPFRRRRSCCGRSTCAPGWPPPARRSRRSPSSRSTASRRRGASGGARRHLG